MAAEIRLLRPTDAAELFALRRRALLDTPEAFLASPEDDAASSESVVRRQLERGPTSAVFGAFGEKLVGMLGLNVEQRRKTAHKALAWGMFVDPQWRGRGLGEGLLRAAVAHARTLDGVQSLRLSVSESAGTARRLYEKVGFRVWGVEPDAMRHGGRSITEHHMALSLAAVGVTVR